jgi:hypothetical protein
MGVIFGPEIRSKGPLGENPGRVAQELFVKVLPAFRKCYSGHLGDQSVAGDDPDLKRTVRLGFVGPGRISSRGERITDESLCPPDMCFPSPPSLGKDYSTNYCAKSRNHRLKVRL